MRPIASDIRKAETLPSSFYRDHINFYYYADKLLSKSWQLIGDTEIFSDYTIVPIKYIDGLINEPLIVCKTGDDFRCLSNVCTHRGNLLVDKPKRSSQMVCGYHGRRFNLQGKVEFMPEFEEAEGFPRACDHLAEINLAKWNQFLFVNLVENFPFESIVRSLDERVGYLDIESFKKSEAHSKTYEVKAHWALYCDNYLEGFHIPFVHPGLNQAVEYDSYTTVLYDHCNLQIGYAKENVESFTLPEGHPDYGKRIAAYYYWIFPNLMLNFYPWGLSVNIIKPRSNELTEVSFVSYVYDESKFEASAGAELGAVELEDEAVVESVQEGMKSRYYSTGRYSPTREQGVHHFHRLISEVLLDN